MYDYQINRYNVKTKAVQFAVSVNEEEEDDFTIDDGDDASTRDEEKTPEESEIKLFCVEYSGSYQLLQLEPCNGNPQQKWEWTVTP